MRAILAIVLLASSYALGGTLNFDDITTGSSASIGSYGGLNFTGFTVEQASANPPFQNAATSGGYTIVSNNPTNISFGADIAHSFQFASAEITGSSNGQVLSIGGFNGVFLVGGENITLNTTPTFVNFGLLMNGVNSVSFSALDGQAFALDDLTYNLPTPLPSPRSLYGLLAMLCLMGGLELRRRRISAQSAR